jgi:hypothetical protein
LNKVRSRWMRYRCRYTVDPLLDKFEGEGVIVAVAVAGSGAVVLVRGMYNRYFTQIRSVRSKGLKVDWQVKGREGLGKSDDGWYLETK